MIRGKELNGEGPKPPCNKAIRTRATSHDHRSVASHRSATQWCCTGPPVAPPWYRVTTVHLATVHSGPSVHSAVTPFAGRPYSLELQQ